MRGISGQTSSEQFSEVERTELKRQAAENLFRQKRFEEAFALYADINAGLLLGKGAVIRCGQHPRAALPRTHRRSRRDDEEQRIVREREEESLQALHLVSRSSECPPLLSKAKFSQLRSELTKQQRKNGGEDKELRYKLILVDTTLLKCYLKVRGKGMKKGR